MKELKWIPTDEAVTAELERQAMHRAELAVLDAEIKKLQARRAAANAALLQQPAWAGGVFNLFAARHQLDVWQAAARSPHPLYLEQEEVRELRSGCLYALKEGTTSKGTRVSREGDRVLLHKTVLTPISKEEVAEVVARLAAIVARLDGAA